MILDGASGVYRFSVKGYNLRRVRALSSARAMNVIYQEQSFHVQAIVRPW